MSPIAKSDLDQISMTIAAAMQSGFAQLTQALAQQPQVVAAKPTAKPQFLPKGSKMAAVDLSAKDAQIVAAFKRKGFADVVLMDRSDKSKPFNFPVPFSAPHAIRGRC